MSEYWKSTPKYWCKFCKTYVRDTKFEKQQHEATPKHQNNIQRSLRDLHRNHEREEREKQRAKDEVERLNGVVAGAASSDPPWKRKGAVPAAAPPKQATPEERKRQAAQLAEMGVAIPEEFRREMAMVGDWQVTAERPVFPGVKKEEEDEDVKPEALNIGVRKRKFEGQEEVEEAGETVVRKGWGSTFKEYPGSKDAGDDLEALLKGVGTVKKQAEEAEPGPRIKKEESEEGATSLLIDSEPATAAESDIKAEKEAPATGIVFKKRKAKVICQR
ncbi:hypothetical protein H2201_001252 [Coniosporium apollinis]|uniref:U1-type domain-containing protein n=1 Tax=Coniosporium apollinis TaxID=61459 RepID=A0ABQ9P1W7_9PEZI|nr:hypothetical protein H2201_001252 [Coniosporium apollinis]